MWIKEKPKDLGASGCCNVNFLFNHGKVYVMDNHLSAGWCWLQKIDTSKQYNFVHIDRHYDLMDYEDEIRASVIEKAINLEGLSFDEYVELTYKDDRAPTGTVQLFKWDNFILNIDHAFPGLLSKTFFVTKKIGEGGQSTFINFEDEIEHFIDQFPDWFEKGETGLIIDIDLDYFFTPIRGGYYQLYSDQTILKLATLVRDHMHKIDVVTIALSPECCGGWNNSFRVLDIFREVLELDL
jgi:UPF0489 domain